MNVMKIDGGIVTPVYLYVKSLQAHRRRCIIIYAKGIMKIYQQQHYVIMNEGSQMLYEFIKRFLHQSFKQYPILMVKYFFIEIQPVTSFYKKVG